MTMIGSPWLERYRGRGAPFEKVVSYAKAGADLGAIVELSRSFTLENNMKDRRTSDTSGGGLWDAQEDRECDSSMGGGGGETVSRADPGDDCLSVENGCRVIPANTTSMEDALRREAKKRKSSSFSRKGAKSAAGTFLTQAGGGVPATTSSHKVRMKAQAEHWDFIKTFMVRMEDDRSVTLTACPPYHQPTP